MSSAFLVAAGFLFFAWKRLETYLHIYQQEEYDTPRFLRWLVGRAAFDRKASISALVTGLLALVLLRDLPSIWDVALAVALVGLALMERDPKTGAKKPLVLTARARRIDYLALVIAGLVAVAVSLLQPNPAVWIVPIQLIPLLLCLATLLLTPVERAGNQKFWNEAHDKVTRLRPKTIAITGSYGKTSVKTLLGHVLQFRGSTLITPGSVNTPMGISRVIREQLTSAHLFFVVEMGAYGKGSIAGLCRLTPPDLAIVTAVGPAHYERFRTLEETASAKMEIAEAAIANGGRVVVNADILAFTAAKALYAAHRERFVTVGTEGDDLLIGAVRETADGISLDIAWRGENLTVFAPLHGAHQARNIALAFAVADELGMSPAEIVAAMRSAPPAAHRLDVKTLANGAKLIDDAYNSNPTGFASALELLSLLKREGGRRILVTPGMVELGARHDEEHARIGRLAAAHADRVLVVQPERIPTFVEAFRRAAKEGQDLHTFPTFAEADAALRPDLGALDVVLIENDLPDLYERKLDL